MAADDRAAETPALRPPRRNVRRAAIVAAALLVLAVAAMLGAVAWVLGTPSGTAFALGHVPGLEVDAPTGRLLGDFTAARIVVRTGGANPGDAGTTVTLLEPSWRRLRLERAPAARLGVAVRVDVLAARRVDLVLAPGPAASGPAVPPRSLRLPVEVEVGRLTIGELHAAALGATPLRELDAAALHFGAGAGAEHRVDRLSLAWDTLRLEGAARMATDAPLTLAARLDATRPAAGALPAVRLDATLDGPLDAPRFAARLGTLATGTPPPRPAQATLPALDLHATLHPFATWPIGDLDATTRALDLAALLPGLPETALDATARITSSGLDQPATVVLDAANARPGRWNDGRLPLRRATLDVAARPDRPSELELRRALVELGGEREAGGRIEATGRGAPQAWSIDATLDALRPAVLDARAPAMTLGGRVHAAQAGGVGTAGSVAPPIELRADLTGRLAGVRAAEDVGLRLDASLATDRIELRRAEAKAAGTRATLAGTAARPDPSAPWTVRGRLALADFDPAIWWPGGAARVGAASAPTRLNVQGDVDLTLAATAGPPPASAPPSVTSAPPSGGPGARATRSPSAARVPAGGLPALLASIRGGADLVLAPSVAAGVAVHGNARFRHAGGATAEAEVHLDAGGNRVDAKARLATGADGSADRVEASVDAPSLATLAPVLARFRPEGGAVALGGRLAASGTLRGRWPALTTDGRFEASALRLPLDRANLLQAGAASGRWALGSTLDAPLEAQAELHRVGIATEGAAGPSVETATLRLAGTGRAHRIELRAYSKARAPAWTETLAGATGATGATGPAGGAVVALPSTAGDATGGTRLTLDADGGFVAGIVPAANRTRRDAGVAAVSTGSGSAPTGWRGRLHTFDLSGGTPGAVPLLHADALAGEADWDGAPRVALQPGRATLLGGAVRWSALAWQAGVATDTARATAPGSPPATTAPRIDIDLELDPIRIAPLLAAAQPGFGWGGDLRIGGRLTVAGRPTFRADAALERRDGDLTVTDEFGTRSLGMTQVALGLTARDGTWRFTEAIAGATLGTAGGTQTVRAAADAVWPGADAPLAGTLAVRVEDLGNWGGFLPPGWRVGGTLDANATLGGRFGAPDYAGRVDGRGLFARNFLLGVLLTDGELGLALRGATARLERLSAQAGGGRVVLDGDASFGASPEARLNLRADRFQLLGRIDRRIVASGAARLRLGAASVALDGRFDVDKGLIDFTRADAPALGGDVRVVRRPAGVASPASAASAAAGDPTAATTANGGPPSGAVPLAPPRRTVALDLRVGLGEKLRIRGRGLDAGLRGDLRVTSPNNLLAVNGTVRVEDGTYDAYGQKLAIDRGVVVFTGGLDDPRLDIQATRRDLDLPVGVLVAGTPADIRVRLYSEPELPDLDKISYLVLGHASDGNDTALLQRAAIALLSGEGGGSGNRLTKALGLDDISFRQGDNGLRDAVVGIGKQISKRWYVGYERGLASTAGSFQLVYRLARRFTLRAQSGDDNSVDLIWSWRWR